MSYDYLMIKLGILNIIDIGELIGKDQAFNKFACGN